MRKLSREQQKKKDELWSHLVAAQEEVEVAAEEYNKEKTRLWKTLAEKVAAYNAIAKEADSFRSDIASEIEGYIGEKEANDEKWDERPKAEPYRDWLREWEDAVNYLDEIELEDDEPEDVDFDIEGPITLENLPIEPNL